MDPIMVIDEEERVLEDGRVAIEKKTEQVIEKDSRCGPLRITYCLLEYCEIIVFNL